MPPFVAPWRRQVIGYAALAVLAGSYVWLIWRHPLLILGASVAIMLVSVVQNSRRRTRLRTTRESRAEESICTFVRALSIREFDTWVVRAVFEQLQNDLRDCCERFPLRPSDRLLEDLRIDPDDLDEVLVWQIAQRSGRSLSDCRANPYYGSVVTIEDLIRFFCAQPKSAT